MPNISGTNCQKCDKSGFELVEDVKKIKSKLGILEF
jgi:hypothetical protein